MAPLGDRLVSLCNRTGPATWAIYIWPRLSRVCLNDFHNWNCILVWIVLQSKVSWYNFNPYITRSWNVSTPNQYVQRETEAYKKTKGKTLWKWFSCIYKRYSGVKQYFLNIVGLWKFIFHLIHWKCSIETKQNME